MGSEIEKTVSLVLGSGGARGYAHIGVIHWLEEHGYRIRSIYGCSMGSLVGGIYAAGKLDEYIAWAAALQRLDIVRLLDPNFGRSGLFKGERVMKALRELVGSHLIEDLEIRFTAVAADIDTQEEVRIDRGPLFDAIRASVAIPTVLTPIEINGRRLVDGGIINPLPVDPALADDTDLTIAVNLSARPSPNPPADPDPGDQEPPSSSSRRKRIAAFFSELGDRMKGDNHKKKDANDPPRTSDLISLSIEIMQGTITNLKLAAAPPDHLINVPRNTCSFYEFHRAEELIALGYKLAQDTISRP
jgi:NTE family protein